MCRATCDMYKESGYRAKEWPSVKERALELVDAGRRAKHHDTVSKAFILVAAAELKPLNYSAD